MAAAHLIAGRLLPLAEIRVAGRVEFISKRIAGSLSHVASRGFGTLFLVFLFARPVFMRLGPRAVTDGRVTAVAAGVCAGVVA